MHCYLKKRGKFNFPPLKVSVSFKYEKPKKRAFLLLFKINIYIIKFHPVSFFILASPERLKFSFVNLSITYSPPKSVTASDRVEILNSLRFASTLYPMVTLSSVFQVSIPGSFRSPVYILQKGKLQQDSLRQSLFHYQ